jgi:cytochrome b involved in lipid metabolism
MKVRFFIGVGLVIIVIVMVSIWSDSSSSNTDTYTLDDIAAHDSSKDCWLAIEGRVYDITPYIADRTHPGGSEILVGCGLDATELFNTRPMGSNTPHSEEARSYLNAFYIGDLAQ